MQKACGNVCNLPTAEPLYLISNIYAINILVSFSLIIIFI